MSSSINLIVSELKSLVTEAKNKAKERVNTGSIHREESITDVFFHHLDHLIKENVKQGIISDYRIIRVVEERILGADVIFSLRFKKNSCWFKKGVLIQAKKGRSYAPKSAVFIGPYRDVVIKVSSDDDGRYAELYDQCRMMRDTVNSSENAYFLFVYSKHCFYYIPAANVLQLPRPSKVTKAEKNKEIRFSSKNVEEFFDNIFNCSFGKQFLGLDNINEAEGMIKWRERLIRERKRKAKRNPSLRKENQIKDKYRKLRDKQFEGESLRMKKISIFHLEMDYSKFQLRRK